MRNGVPDSMMEKRFPERMLGRTENFFFESVGRVGKRDPVDIHYDIRLITVMICGGHQPKFVYEPPTDIRNERWKNNRQLDMFWG